MVTHFQGENTTITGTGPLLHCPMLPSGIWPNFTIQLPTIQNVPIPMQNASISQRLDPTQVQQVPGSYHGSQSCPSSGYPALLETHYHPSQVLSSAHRFAPEHTPLGGTNAGPYHPTGPASTITLYTHLGIVLPQGIVILLKVHLSLIK